MAKMTEAQRNFVTALVDGSHKQAKETLRRGRKTCCLGVACDISGLGKWVAASHNLPGEVKIYHFVYGTDEYDFESSTLPENVALQLDLGDVEDPNLIAVRPETEGASPDLITAVECNDEFELTFPQIAFLFKNLFETGEPYGVASKTGLKDVIPALALAALAE